MAIENDLKASVRGEVDVSSASLDRASRDASLFRVRPSVVVSPADAADVGRLVSFVAARKADEPSLSLTARSAGTDMSGGPLTESVVVDMARHFGRIVSVSDDSAVVEPGALYRDFEKATLAKGLLLPSYPASRDLCTVGGMAANNSGGEKTLRYGKTDRYVRRLNVVLSDGREYTMKKLSAAELEHKKSSSTFEGELYRTMDALITNNAEVIEKARPRVSKNSSGYALWNVRDADGSFDLTKLFVGSQGTLGIITEIEFSLVRPKPHSRMLVIFLRDLAPLAEVAERVMRHQPESFESYDDHTLSVALRLLPQLVRRMKGNAIRLAFRFFPEARMAVTGGLPKLVLIAEFTAETGEAAEAAAVAARDELAGMGLRTNVTKSEAEGEKYWTIRRESFNLLRHHVNALQTAPFIDDFVVRREDLSSFLPELYAILEAYPRMIFTVAGHVGDGNFHIIPLMDVRLPETAAIIRALSEKVYALVIRYGGSITGEHNDGMIRTPFVKRMFGAEMEALFEKTKRAFDPLGLFNPGKKVSGDFDDAMAHLDIAS